MSKVTSRDTKAKILAAYNELYNDHSELQKAYNKLKDRGGSSAARPAAAAAPVKPAGGKFNLSDIISSLGGLKASFGDSTAVLQQKLTTEVTALQNITSEIASHQAELASLYNVEDVTDATLGELIKQHKELSNAADEELSEKENSLSEELKTTRETWSKEKSEYNAATRERNDELKKERKREQESYQYDLNHKRALDADQYAQELKERQKELDDLKEAKQNAWNAKEKELSEREDEFAELKKQDDKFPKELEKAVSKAKEEGTGIAKRQARIERNLLEKENEGKRRVYELRIQSLETVVQKQADRVVSLSDQLQKAQEQAQSLASKAIEGASDSRSFQAMKEIALEQAKNMQKGK